MNNYVKKLSAFAVSAAMLLTAAGLNFVRPLEASEPVSGTRALTPLSAKALSATSADAGEAGLEQLDIAFSAENSEQVDTACDTLTVLLEQELAAQNTMPDILDDPVLEARRQQYRNEITVRAARTRAALEAVRSGEADEEALQTIREAFSETGASHRSTATPSAAKHLQDAETEEGSLTKTAPQPLPETPPTTEETYLNSDTDIPEEVRNYAQNLGSAVEIYRFVKEKIVYEAYAGSKKAAEVTLDQFGGNDIDQARLLKARHKGVKGVTNQGSLVGYRMEQTWAEAYVPYTDYRGAGNAKGRSVWVPLDPSFKTLTTLTDTVTFDYSDDEKAVIAAMDALADEQPVIHADYVRPGNTAEVSVRSVDAVDDGYLPASLPYDRTLSQAHHGLLYSRI